MVDRWWILKQAFGTVVCGRRLFGVLRLRPTSLAGNVFEVGLFLMVYCRALWTFGFYTIFVSIHSDECNFVKVFIPLKVLQFYIRIKIMKWSHD